MSGEHKQEPIRHPLATLQKRIVPSAKVVVTDHTSAAQLDNKDDSYIPPVALITPFPDETSDSLVQRYKNTIQSLIVPPFPLLSEERYYSYLVHENDFPRWSFAELVEIVDLARENNFNFIAVSAKLKHRNFSPVSCLQAFQQYANIILWRQNFLHNRYTLVGTGNALKESYSQFNHAISILAFYAGLGANNNDLGDAEIYRQFNLRLCLAATSPLRTYGKYTFTQMQYDILTGNISSLPSKGDSNRSSVVPVAPVFRDSFANNISDGILDSVKIVPSTYSISRTASQQGHAGGTSGQPSRHARPYSNNVKWQNAIVESATAYANLKQEGGEYLKSMEGSLTTNMSENLLEAMLPDFGMHVDFINSELYGFIESDEEKLVERPGKEQRDPRIMRGCLGVILNEALAEYKSICAEHPARARSLPSALNLQVDPSLPRKMNMAILEQTEKEIPIHVAQINRYPMNGAMLLHSPKVYIPGHMRIDLSQNLAGGRYAKASGSAYSTSSSTGTGASSPYMMPPHAFAVSWRYRYYPTVERGKQLDQTASIRHNMWQQELPSRESERKRAASLSVCNQMHKHATYIDLPMFVELENHIEGIDG